MAKRKGTEPNDILLGFVTNGLKAGGDIIDVRTGRRLGGVREFKLESHVDDVDVIRLVVYRHGKKHGKILAHR